MARMARVVVPGVAHHVTQRGNRRQKTFFGVHDYKTYIDLLAKYCRKADTEVWAYCLMPNHVHLVLVPHTTDGLRMALGEAHRHYTRYINFREEWRGHLWQERFHSFPMDESHLLSAVRYVERNPVAAGLCEHSEQWPWSSAKAHIRAENDSLVNVEPMLARVENWEEYLDESSKVSCDEKLIAKHARTGRPLGDNNFVKRLEAITGRRLRVLKPGPKATGGD